MTLGLIDLESLKLVNLFPETRRDVPHAEAGEGFA